MWLGLVAVLTAFGYALVKFITTVHMRRLRETHMRLAHEVKRDRQRLQALESKLQVQRATCGSAQQKLLTARRFKDDLFGRLRLELPSAMVAELRQCVNRHPIPEPEGVRTAHELGLADKVSEALTQLSILIVEIAGDEEAAAARTVLHGELVQALEARKARHAQPRRVDDAGAPLEVTTAFDTPQPALDVLRALATSHADTIGCVRAVLVAGVHVTEFDKEHVNRLFARTLHGARQLLGEARPGALLINERAHDLLHDRKGILQQEGSEPLWVLSLEPAGDTPEAAPTVGPDGAPAAETAAELVDPDRGVVPAEAPPAGAAPDEAADPKTP